MPFTMSGDWIPSVSSSNNSQKPVKVRLVKKGKNILTVIYHLNMTDAEMVNLSSRLKKKLGCGGAVKEGEVIVQGDKVHEVVSFLVALGINPSK